ncbi:E3 ubiquitin-protein ligase rnf14, partial [Borealophlyctis nickersoniae]
CAWLRPGQKEGLKRRLVGVWEAAEGDVVLYDFAEFLGREVVGGECGVVERQDDETLMLTLASPATSENPQQALEIADYIMEHDRRMEQEEFDSGSYDCGVCFETKRGTACFRFAACKHVYCRECLNDYFTVLINDGLVHQVGCPDNSCKKQQGGRCSLADSEVSAIVGPELALKHMSLIAKIALESRTDVTYCPRPHCQSPVIRDAKQEKLIDGLTKVVDEWLAGDERKRAEMEVRYGKKTLGKLVKDVEAERESIQWMKENATACPNCYIRLQKNGGCNHMTCQVCNTHFCYLCGAFLSKKEPYVHFNDKKSPCYGLLFEGEIPPERLGLYEEEEEEEEETWFPDDAVVQYAVIASAPVERKDRVYAPPNWDKKEFNPGTATFQQLQDIAKTTYTKISYNPDAHSVLIVGEELNHLFEARRKIEELFAPVVVRSTRPWDRPHRPGQWGQRRDHLPPTVQPGGRFARVDDDDDE